MLTVDSTCLHKMSQVHSKLPGDDALVIGTENPHHMIENWHRKALPTVQICTIFQVALRYDNQRAQVTHEVLSIEIY